MAGLFFTHNRAENHSKTLDAPTFDMADQIILDSRAIALSYVAANDALDAADNDQCANSNQRLGL